MTFLTAEQIQTHRTRTVTNARKAVQEVFGEKFGTALFSTSLRNWGLGPVSTQAFLVGAVDLIQDAWKHHQDIAGVLLCKNPQGGFIPLYLHLPSLAYKLANKKQGYWVDFNELLEAME